MASHAYLGKLGFDEDLLRRRVEMGRRPSWERDGTRDPRFGRCSPTAIGIGIGRWETRVGEIDVAIPKLRQGSYLPAFLDARRA